MKVVDFDGNVLDATFLVVLSEQGLVSVVFESSGGHEGGPNPRNLEYRQGAQRTSPASATDERLVNEIRVETERTRLLPVRAATHSYPRPYIPAGSFGSGRYKHVPAGD